MKTHHFYVYILTTYRNTVLYIGVTNDLKRRALEHKSHVVPGFTKIYNVDKLIFYESFTFIEDAIHREKLLKKWHRQWKIELITTKNPDWNDLTPTL